MHPRLASRARNNKRASEDAGEILQRLSRADAATLRRVAEVIEQLGGSSDAKKAPKRGR